MFAEKIDHEPIIEPRLLDLTGMAGSGQSFQFAIWYPRFEREGALVAAVLTAGQDDRRAGDALMVAVRIGLCESLELVDDGLHIGVFITFAEKVGEEMRQRRRAKPRTQILERIGPAIIDAVGSIIIDAPFGEFFSGVVAGARQHERRRLIRALVVHKRNN